MYQAPEQLIALNKASLDTAMRIADIALASTERMFDVQMKTMKAALADSAEQAKSMTEMKNIRDLSQLKASVQPGIEKATTYVKSIYDVAASTQSQISKLFEEQISEYNKQFVSAMDKAVKNAPAGSEMAVAAVKSAMSVVNSTYDNLTKSAKQFTEMTNANVEAAATTAKKKAA